MDIPQTREQIVPRRSRTTAASILRLFLFLLGAVLGGLTCQPTPVFAGDLPIPRFAASETDGLSLTPSQKQKLTALESASRAQAHQLIGQIEKLRHILSEAYEAYSVDVAAVRRTNQALNHVQAQLLDLRLSEQVQLRRILSPEQFAQLQAAIRKRGPDDDRRHESEERQGPRDEEKEKP